MVAATRSVCVFAQQAAKNGETIRDLAARMGGEEGEEGDRVDTCEKERLVPHLKWVNTGAYNSTHIVCSAPLILCSHGACALQSPNT
mmetsp:Transcript_36432/g.91693  ORF Transcript_36432/g.91693 Transcript_36432/m.91693 type:complete len:87 (-) Transcript_36432:491-751(-)